MRRARIRGFNLIEVLVAAFILVFMALMVAAVIPSSIRSVKTASSYTLASVIAQRKLDQLTETPAVGYSNLTTLALEGLTQPGAIISRTGGTSADACEWFDPATTTSGTFGRTNYRLVGYFTKLDGLRKTKSDAACASRSGENAFPGGDDVQGKIEISGWQGKNAADTNSSLMRATVTITWKTAGQGKSVYSVSTLIPRSGIL